MPCNESWIYCYDPENQETEFPVEACWLSQTQEGQTEQIHPQTFDPFFAPYDFWLFSKLRGCRYETIEEMKEAVTKVIDTLTQEDFHGAFEKLLERYKCIAAGGDYFEGTRVSCVYYQ